jgi:hypothetical protein
LPKLYCKVFFSLVENNFCTWVHNTRAIMVLKATFLHHALVKAPPRHMQVELVFIQSWGSSKFSKFSGKESRLDLCNIINNQQNACFSQQPCNSRCTLALMSLNNICQERIVCEDRLPTSQNKDCVRKCTKKWSPKEF